MVNEDAPLLEVMTRLRAADASVRVDLFARSTAMPVIEAGEDMLVEANHVYVLPPNKYMTIGAGKLHLTGPHDAIARPANGSAIRPVPQANSSTSWTGRRA